MKKFKLLFEKVSKDEAKRYCERDIQVSFDEMYRLITSCLEINFSHQPKYCSSHQVSPVQLTEKNYRELNDHSKSPAVVLNKLIKAFEPHRTKIVTAHFFTSNLDPLNWHCFFWTGADIQGAEGGKVWREISHIHYTSHLFGLTKEECEIRIEPTGYKGIDKAHLKLC
jgi:hypothetical protein